MIKTILLRHIITKRNDKKFALFIFCFPLLALPSYAQKTWDTIPNMPQHYSERIALFKNEPIVTGKIIFLGNSITEGANWKKLLKDSTIINRGVSGDITFGVLNRIDDVVKRKASKLFVLIGINDLYKGIPDEVVLQNVFTLVRMIKSGSPKTQLFIQSILPVNKTFKNFPKGYDQEDHITTINGQLKKLSKHFDYTYVDLYNQFTNTNLQLEEKYSFDGLHLNASGYAHWVELLKNAKYL
jgi:lysophospholipase L1-like esterase